ncbi:MAG: hypothetical protein JXA57_10310 [Armatimonadetes bacterium]|nr:hypothetical protein [Armatimonadota bacterium]
MTLDLLYYCDAVPAIGMGHMRRGMDILHAMTDARPGLRLALCGQYGPSARAFMTAFLRPSVSVFEPSGFPSARIVALDTMTDPEDPGAVDGAFVERLRGATARLVLISSARRLTLAPGVDLLIDHLPDVEILGPPPRRRMLGFAYAPVSGAFLREVAAAPKAPAEGILCAIGGGPSEDGPSQLLSALREAVGPLTCPVDVVVSPHMSAAGVAEFRQRFADVRVHQNLPSLAPLVASARAVICTYGNFTYEALAAHKPVFVTGYKDFQVKYASYLERLGLVVSLGRFDSLDLSRLSGVVSHEVLRSLSESAARSAVGPGIDRIAALLVEEIGSVQNS